MKTKVDLFKRDGDPRWRVRYKLPSGKWSERVASTSLVESARLLIEIAEGECEESSDIAALSELASRTYREMDRLISIVRDIVRERGNDNRKSVEDDLKILEDFIRRRGGEITVRNLQNGRRSYRNDRDKAELHLRALVRSGVARSEYRRNGRGRPSEVFVLLDTKTKKETSKRGRTKTHAYLSEQQVQSWIRDGHPRRPASRTRP